MSQQQEQFTPQDDMPSESGVQQQQQQQPQPQSNSEAHGGGGQGSESALKQLRVWEQRRASNFGGKRRQGPN